MTPGRDGRLGVLGLFFLKVGAVLYGSGYVLVAFLDSVNVSAVGLMAAVVVSLGAGALDSPTSWAVGMAAAVAALAFRLNAAWIIAGGALVGGATALLG